MIEDLKKAKNIGIVISNYENVDHVATALTLFLIAKKLNKPVYYKLNKSLSIFPQMEKSNPQIVVTVEKEIADIFYEKTEKSIKLFLTAKDKKISPSDFTCNIMNLNQNICCDLIITIGFKDFKEIEDEAGADFENIYNAEIINIDNSHLNKRFGKVNLIENGSSLSKVLFNNLEENLIDKNIASLILSGVKEGEIETAQKLGEKGGKLDTVYKIRSLISVLNSMEAEENIYISQMNTLEASDVPFILQILKEYLHVPEFILIFNNKDCIFYLKDEDNLEKIKVHFNAQIKNKGGIFSKENLDKEEVLNILK